MQNRPRAFSAPGQGGNGQRTARLRVQAVIAKSRADGRVSTSSRRRASPTAAQGRIPPAAGLGSERHFQPRTPTRLVSRGVDFAGARADRPSPGQRKPPVRLPRQRGGPPLSVAHHGPFWRLLQRQECLLNTISTRLFFWRLSGSSEPSGFVFGATGPEASIVVRHGRNPPDPCS
jgi:hypothetical protein